MRSHFILRVLSFLTIFFFFFSTVSGFSKSQGPQAHLRYLGHASFEWITLAGTKIIIDPYQNSLWSHWFDQDFPQLRADLVLITHDHFDHNAVSKIKGRPTIINKPAVKKENDFVIQSIAGRHARPDKWGASNLIFILEINKIRFIHWGDNGAEINDDLLYKLGRLDVLILPVDESEHLLTIREVDEIRKRLSPKIVIPVHYFIPGLTSPCSTLQTIDRWLSQQNHVRRVPSKGITIFANALPKAQEIWIFDRFGHSSPAPKRTIASLLCFLRNFNL